MGIFILIRQAPFEKKRYMLNFFIAKKQEEMGYYLQSDFYIEVTNAAHSNKTSMMTEEKSK